MDGFTLIGPKGVKMIDDFESGAAWSHSTVVNGGANGSKSALKIHCPADSHLTSRRPATATPSLDVASQTICRCAISDCLGLFLRDYLWLLLQGLSFDTVEDYDHILFWWKVSSDYSNSLLSQDLPFAINASTSIGNSAPFGQFEDRHVVIAF